MQINRLINRLYLSSSLWGTPLRYDLFRKRIDQKISFYSNKCLNCLIVCIFMLRVLQYSEKVVKKEKMAIERSYALQANAKKLKEFIYDLSKKRPTIKFDRAYSKISIVFLDTKFYKNQNGMLYTTIYRKSIDWSNFLSCAWAHQKSLKGSITFSQVLRIKRICSEISVIRYF